MRTLFRDDIAKVVLMAVVYMGVGLMLEAMTQFLPDGEKAMFSLASLGAFVVLTAILVVFEVRAYRSIVCSCGNLIGGSDKVLLAASLWFFGGLPTAITSMIRCSIGGEGDMRALLVQVGVTASLCLLSAIKVREALRQP